MFVCCRCVCVFVFGLCVCLVCVCSTVLDLGVCLLMCVSRFKVLVSGVVSVISGLY